jgi:lipopolysaccharide/colanic/teichoic acid biosynthesis glycosyltransferase
LRLKGVIDMLAATMLLLLTAPVILVTALLVRATSRGPAFYTQTRVGRDGRLFTIFKIRTMVHNCESLTGPRWSIPGDPRITWLGHFLRKTHLDELPQLFNVLRGEMSLIGPRPERPEFTAKLERALPAYPERLRVKPGVTGLAQVHLPGDTSLASVRLKLAHDLFYIQQLSPGLELRILFALRCASWEFLTSRFADCPAFRMRKSSNVPCMWSWKGPLSAVGAKAHKRKSEW